MNRLHYKTEHQHANDSVVAVYAHSRRIATIRGGAGEFRVFDNTGGRGYEGGPFRRLNHAKKHVERQHDQHHA